VPDFFEAGTRVGIVANDIADADIIGDALRGSVGKHSLKGFEVGVNVTEKSDPHERDTIGSGKDCRIYLACRDEIIGNRVSTRKFRSRGPGWLRRREAWRVAARARPRFLF
jgi:hypothetical protein